MALFFRQSQRTSVAILSPRFSETLHENTLRICARSLQTSAAVDEQVPNFAFAIEYEMLFCY